MGYVIAFLIAFTLLFWGLMAMAIIIHAWPFFLILGVILMYVEYRRQERYARHR